MMKICSRARTLLSRFHRFVLLSLIVGSPVVCATETVAEQDRGECNSWAVFQAGGNPTVQALSDRQRKIYEEATKACLASRTQQREADQFEPTPKALPTEIGNENKVEEGDEWVRFDRFVLVTEKNTMNEVALYIAADRVDTGRVYTQSDYGLMVATKIGYDFKARNLIDEHPDWSAEDIFLETKGAFGNADRDYIYYLHQNRIGFKKGEARAKRLRAARNKCVEGIKVMPPTKRPEGEPESHCVQQILVRNIDI